MINSKTKSDIIIVNFLYLEKESNVITVSYMRLWHLLLDKKMKKKDLEAATSISHYVINKMSCKENISTEAVGKICKALNYTPEQMMEFIFDEES